MAMPFCDCGTPFCVTNPDDLIPKALQWKDVPIEDVYKAWVDGERFALVALMMHIRNPRGDAQTQFDVSALNTLLDLGIIDKLLAEARRLGAELVDAIKVAMEYQKTVEDARAKAAADPSAPPAADPAPFAIPEGIDSHYVRFVTAFLVLILLFVSPPESGHYTETADTLLVRARIRARLGADRTIQETVIALRAVPDVAMRHYCVQVLKLLQSFGLWADMCGNPACGKVHPGGSAPLFQQCSACRVVVYCGAACQKAHWKSHKSHCKQLAEMNRRQDAGLPMFEGAVAAAAGAAAAPAQVAGMGADGAVASSASAAEEKADGPQQRR